MNKLLSCRYNMDTNRVEARFADGSTIAIDCIAIEDEYGNAPAQRAELDWLPIDKLSVVITLALAFFILHEPFTAKSLVGCTLIAAGTLFMVL